MKQYSDGDFDNRSNRLSRARLTRYLRSAGFKKGHAVSLYVWNTELSESFDFPLHIMEVAVRNNIHAALQQLFANDWHIDGAFRALLPADHLKRLNQAESQVVNNYPTCTVDQIVAALSFGFWTALLKAHFDAAIWTTHLRSVFPNLPGGHTLKDVRIRVSNVNWFRNRVAHHEPIYETNLTNYYSEITSILAWVDMGLLNWVRAHSRVPTVIRSRPTAP